MIRVLNCSSHEELRCLRAAILAQRNCHVVSPESTEAALGELQAGRFEVLLLCYKLPADDESTLCEQFRQKFPKGRIVAVEHPSTPRVRCAADRIVSAHDPAAMVSAIIGHPYAIRGGVRAL